MPPSSRRRSPILRFTVIVALIPIALFGPRPALADKAKLKHSPRFLVVQQLQHGLAGTPLEPYAFVLEREGRRWNVNPYLVASIAGVESSFGAAACGGNAWGIASCGMSFASFAEGAAYTSRLLRQGWLARGTSDVWSIGRSYCPPCGSRWGDQVAWFMRARFGSAPSVTYPG